jgi:hypothetical protein
MNTPFVSELANGATSFGAFVYNFLKVPHLLTNAQEVKPQARRGYLYVPYTSPNERTTGRS